MQSTIFLQSIANLTNNTPEPSIAILMCTYNGAQFIRAQLDSILSQTHDNWTLYISDDGSKDATRQIIESYKERLPEKKLILLEGPQRGFSRNFISLIKNPQIDSDYFAFCDQDDVWLDDKLERSIKCASSFSTSQPFLYCSRTRLINADGEPTGLSPLFMKRPSFQNALVQSLAGANTMLINTATKRLLSGIPDDAPIPAHDWLAYLVVSAAGGAIVYDALPSLNYRQHEFNLIGANAGVKAKLSRLRKIFSGRFEKWNTQNIILLETMLSHFTKENAESFELFVKGRTLGFFNRVLLIKRSGVYRQTLAGNISLWVAAAFKKL